jgi:dCMP deaminase
MSEVLQEIFKEQRDFIIIGLTGRTGSGCTTIADILSNTLDLNEPEIHGNEERKSLIVNNFIKEKWSPFTKITVSNIITSFIFDYPGNFLEYIQEKYKVEITTDIFSDYEKLKEIYLGKGFNLENCETVNSDEVYDFYFKEIEKFSSRFKKCMKYSYTQIFQDLGDNLRHAGYVNEEASADRKLLRIPERINSLIKIIKDYNEAHGKEKYFVIDAIRNPFEALFFRQRFSAFYLIAINTPNEERRNRLFERRNLTYKQIDDLDNREFDGQKNNLIIVNVKKCIENADIHIENSDNEIPDDFSKLKTLLAKYISLMMHPGLITPTKIERCMQIAYIAKFNSGCISRQVGAVVTDQDYSIKSIGWNDTPYGQTPCLLKSVNNLININDTKAYSDFELKNSDFKAFIRGKFIPKLSHCYLKGRNFSYCFKDEYNEYKHIDNQVNTRALHAEENAFLQISKYGGMGIKDGILFTTASPCELCSKKAYQLGIKKIIYIDLYPGISQSHILNCGINRPTMELFSGAIGRAYHKLFEPIMSYKDEISILIGEFDD